MFEDNQGQAPLSQRQTTKSRKRIRVPVGENWDGLTAEVHPTTKRPIIYGIAGTAGALVLVFTVYAMFTGDKDLLHQCWDLVRQTYLIAAIWAFGVVRLIEGGKLRT